MGKTLLSLAAAAGRWLPAPVKSVIYRLGPISRMLRSALTSAAPKGLTETTVAGGGLAGARLLLDLQSEKDYWLGTYEMELQQAIRDWAQPDMVAHDLGANIGYASLLLAKRVGKNGQVFSFEPLPSNQDRLQKNLDLNPNLAVKLIRKAVTDKPGKTVFLVHASGGMGKLQGSLGKNAEYEKKMEVDTICLDDFVYKENNAPPQIIKIDIEGGEANALRGMAHIVSLARPILLVELHGFRAAEAVWNFLDEAGYSLHVMRKGYPKVASFDELGKKSYIVARAN